MKINEVATRTGLSIHTLRYYEQIGLVAPINRFQNGHRQYTDDDVYRIVFVTRLRAAGMPIAEIKRYVDRTQEGDSTLGERLEILEHHQHMVEEQIAELQHHLKLISDKIAHYHELHDHQLANTAAS